MAGNLTRDEARERARILDVDSYTVELDLTTGDETFRSTTNIRFSSSEPGARTFVELVAPRVLSATLNGTELDPGELFDGERLVLPEVAADNELTVVADAAYMRTGEGLHRFVDPVDEAVYLYSQFETADAQRMYACFDQPDLKACFELTVFAPPSWEVISNQTPATERADTGIEGRVRWHFPPTPRIPTYITALIAGPYHVVRDKHDGIPLGLFCRASLAEHLDAEPSSKSPSRASTSSTSCSVSVTRSASTTSCSYPSSTPGRWRTPGRSRSWRTTSSVPGSPTPGTNVAPRPSFTRWRTCGSATW